MNSWHSWSPNSKWLVFTSKINTPYTQLFLTHIDEEGRSTPPVLLSHFTAPDRAANIPEFVNNKPTAIKNIREEFLDDYSFVRAGNEFLKAGEVDNAIGEYKNALDLNPNNVEAHWQTGYLYYNNKEMHEEGIAHLTEAIRLSPGDPRVNYDLGVILVQRGEYKQAVKYLSIALQQMPEWLHRQYRPANMHHSLGMALFHTGKLRDSARNLSDAVRLDPGNANFHYALAMVLAARGNIDEPLAHYKEAMRIDPEIDKSPTLHDLLGMNYARAGQFQEAIVSANKAIALARAAGSEELARSIEAQVELYKQNKVGER